MHLSRVKDHLTKKKTHTHNTRHEMSSFELLVMAKGLPKYTAYSYYLWLLTRGERLVPIAGDNMNFRNKS